MGDEAVIGRIEHGGMQEAPDALSTWYLTGAPPCGISMTTLISCGGFSPTGMWQRSMIRRP
jgi:hypothetical protein